jgi:hypothetical protein
MNPPMNCGLMLTEIPAPATFFIVGRGVELKLGFKEDPGVMENR